MEQEKIMLKDGDGLEILSETKDFDFGCCDCGLVHNITVEHKKESTILRFYRVPNRESIYVSDCCATDKEGDTQKCSSCSEYCEWIDIK